MESEDSVGAGRVIPRGNREGLAPKDTMFPAGHPDTHDEGCVKDAATYTCSCGATVRAMERGDFVRYEPILGAKGNALKDLESYLKRCREDSAAVDMVAFNKRASK